MKCTGCSCCVWSKARPASSSFRSLLNGPPEAKEEEGKWVFTCSPFNILYATPSFRNHHPPPYGQAGIQSVSHSLESVSSRSFIEFRFDIRLSRAPTNTRWRNNYQALRIRRLWGWGGSGWNWPNRSSDLSMNERRGEHSFPSAKKRNVEPSNGASISSRSVGG